MSETRESIVRHVLKTGRLPSPPVCDLTKDPVSLEMLREIAARPWKLDLWGILGDYVEEILNLPRAPVDELAARVSADLKNHRDSPRREQRRQRRLLVEWTAGKLRAAFGDYVEIPF